MNELTQIRERWEKLNTHLKVRSGRRYTVEVLVSESYQYDRVQDCIDHAASDIKTLLDALEEIMDLPLLTLPDVAQLAGVSSRYARNEATSGRLPVKGEGKDRRVTWRAYQHWMSNPRRGSRRKKEDL